jgi:hypothetical protein
VVAVETGPAIQGLLTEVDGRAILVLDDLEVLSGLGGGSRLDVVRAAVGPAIARDTDAHPGLAVRRPEHAAAMVSLCSDWVVVPLDVVSLPPLPRFDADRFRAGLGALIVGQDPVLARVTGRLSLTRRELDLRPTRPDAVWLFAGPTGTGKAALAEAIATELFG